MFQELKGFLQGFDDRREGLDALSVKIRDISGVESSFCRIIARRWSFYAGSKTPLYPEKRVRINSEWGVVLGGEFPRDKERLELMDILRNTL